LNVDATPATTQSAQLVPSKRPTDLVVLVPSCDAYRDIWPAFFDSLFRSWPDCPFPVVLLSNEAECTDPRITTLKVGPDLGWSANLRKALAELPQKYVLLVIDDLFPTARIDTTKILELMTEVGDFNYLRLNPHPGPRRTLSARVGHVPSGDIYRTSTVYSVWRRQVLGELLRDDESAWQFELNGSARSDHFDRWYASREWLVPYVNLVVKRKLDPLALRKLRGMGIDVRSTRTRMTIPETSVLFFRALRSWVFAKLPWQVQRRLRGNF
jgi:hypothetical protein